MAYVVNRYNESVLTVVNDYTVNDDFDIKLIGRHYIDYGEIQNENMVYMLENFSNEFPPNNPISGQLWYDSFNSKLNVYDSGYSGFVSVNRPAIGATPPSNMVHGELWFDTLNQRLCIHNGVEIITIGPTDIGLIGTGPDGGASSDLSFWWDDTTFKLYVIDDGDNYLIGPSDDEILALAHIL